MRKSKIELSTEYELSKAGNWILVPYCFIHSPSVRYENQYLIKFPFVSHLISGCFGRRQRDTQTGAVGHSIQEVEARWVTAALSHWNVQSSLSLSNLTVHTTATMAPSHITKAYYSTFRTEHCVYSLYACFTRATSSSESGTSCEAHWEWTLRAVLSTKRCTGTATNCPHEGARSRPRLWQRERYERTVELCHQVWDSN